MSSKMHSGKTVWIAAAAAILVILLVILLAVKSTPGDHDTIVLPTPSVDANEGHNQSDSAAEGEQSDFVEVTNDNVATVLQTLSRPSSYRQSYTVTVGSGERQHEKTVNLWVNSGITHAEIVYKQQTQSMITDGKTLYLWYDNQRNYISLQLDDGFTPEDILGLPDFDAYLQLSPSSVTEANYLLLEDAQISCIYVSATYAENCEIHYWINLENGLMYQSEAIEADKLVYVVQQAGFDLLAAEDEGFSDKFVLPDGTVPFTVETRMLQP